ncbi:MAG: hypothetical protein AB8B96_10995 [Lysobacterales bacterium]
MTWILPKEGFDSAGPRVALIGSPHHSLGVALCRHLASQGVRLVITDPDPARGAAVCRRLAWQGVSASYRYFSAESSQCEQRLFDDLSLVFGRLDWLISFFDVARFEPAWLSLDDQQVRHLLMPQLEFRRRLLSAMDPLFVEGATHLQVCMGGNGDGDTAMGLDVTSASALLWDRLLSRTFRSHRIRTQTLSVMGEGEAIDSAARAPRSIERDLSRLILALEP